MVQYSFASQGRAYGFSRRANAFSGKLLKKIDSFGPVHARFKDVNVENTTWQKIVERYDHKTAVFYMDPPYFDSDMAACYGKNVMDRNDHEHLLERVKYMKGTVVLSGYANKLYDSYTWNKRYTKESFVSTTKTEHERTKAEEVLWVKSAT